MNGSYNINNFTKNRKTEIKRLKSQVELFFERELEIYKRIGMQDDTKVIECGCGPGYLLFNLANKFSNCTFMGLEIDSFLFEVFQKNISQYNTLNVRAKQGSVYHTGEDDEFYDVVISRLVIEHLEKPYDALLELYRILKPGGKLIIVSNDFEYHVLTNPHIPELDLMYKAYCKSRIDEGGNPFVGRELPIYMKKLGAQQIQINIATAHSSISGDKALLKAENINISRSLVTKGYLEQEILDRLSNKWFEMLQNSEHVIYRQLFIVSGEKQSDREKTESSAKEVSTGFEATSQIDKLDKKSNITELTYLLTNKIISSIDEESLEINPAIKLNEYYIDSLVATDIASFMKEQFKINIKLTDILKEFSVNDLVKIILDSNSSLNKKNDLEQSAWTEGEL